MEMGVKNNNSKGIKWIIKTVIMPMVLTIITAVGGFIGGSKVEETKVVDKINQQVNVNVNTDNYIKEIEKLLKENSILKKENDQLKKEKENVKEGETDKNTEINTKTTKSLLDISEAMNVCGGFEEILNGDSMDLRGDKYSNGFTLDYSYDTEEGVEFKLRKKYNDLSFDLGHVDNSEKGKIKLYIYSDEKLVKTFVQDSEDAVTHYDIKIGNADIIKIAWSAESFTKFGMANVKVKRV